MAVREESASWPNAFVYLTYWDDAGSDKRSSVLVFGGIIVPTDRFRHLEMKHADTVRRLIPEDRRDEFKEFHSYQLWNGEPPFDGIDFDDRRTAMGTLLYGLKEEGLGYFYSAVDKAKLKGRAIGSVDPIDVAFRMCLGSLELWAKRSVQFALDAQARGLMVPFVHEWLNDVCLVVVDDDINKRGPKEQLRASFRDFRKRLHNSYKTRPDGSGRIHLSYLHDAMFFGDSTESVGLQLADVCGYVIRRHLEGLPTEGLYELLKPHAFVADAEPDWSMLRDALVCHDESRRVSGPSVLPLRVPGEALR